MAKLNSWLVDFSGSTRAQKVFTVDERYSHLHSIGRGSYGFVAGALDSVTGRQRCGPKSTRINLSCDNFYNAVTSVPLDPRKQVAIKLIPDYSSIGSEDQLRVAREIAVLRFMRGAHHVVNLLDVSTFPPRTPDFQDIYIVMEWYPTDLEYQLNSPHFKLEEYSIRVVFYELLIGLQQIHSSGVLHRDLKPANVLMSNEATAICDFTLARGFSQRPQSSAPRPLQRDVLTKYVVTRWYRAPELLLEAPDQSYGPPVDVWSLGCILGEMLSKLDHGTRKVLFQGRSMHEQLYLIFQRLGTPSQRSLLASSSAAAAAMVRQTMVTFPKPAVPFRDEFHKASDAAIDLLGRMLTFDSSQRISAALRHPFFAGMGSPPPRPPRAPFRWLLAAEYADRMIVPTERLQCFILEEIAAQTAECQLRVADIKAAVEQMHSNPETPPSGDVAYSALHAARDSGVRGSVDVSGVHNGTGMSPSSSLASKVAAANRGRRTTPVSFVSDCSGGYNPDES